MLVCFAFFNSSFGLPLYCHCTPILYWDRLLAVCFDPWPVYWHVAGGDDSKIILNVLQLNSSAVLVLDAVLRVPSTVNSQATTGVKNASLSIASYVTLSKDCASKLDTTPNSTVIAPSDTAFALLPTLEYMSSMAKCKLFSNHIGYGVFYSSTLSAVQSFESYANLPLTVHGKDGNQLFVNGCRLNSHGLDRLSVTGVLHVLDCVVIPPPSSFTPPLPISANMLQVADLVAASLKLHSPAFKQIYDTLSNNPDLSLPLPVSLPMSSPAAAASHAKQASITFFAPINLTIGLSAASAGDEPITPASFEYLTVLDPLPVSLSNFGPYETRIEPTLLQLPFDYIEPGGRKRTMMVPQYMKLNRQSSFSSVIINDLSIVDKEAATSNFKSSNGLLQMTDVVLPVPNTISATATELLPRRRFNPFNCSLMLDLLRQEGLLESLDEQLNVTLFLPTNDVILNSNVSELNAYTTQNNI